MALRPWTVKIGACRQGTLHGSRRFCRLRKSFVRLAADSSLETAKIPKGGILATFVRNRPDRRGDDRTGVVELMLLIRCSCRFGSCNGPCGGNRWLNKRLSGLRRDDGRGQDSRLRICNRGILRQSALRIGLFQGHLSVVLFREHVVGNFKQIAGCIETMMAFSAFDRTALCGFGIRQKPHRTTIGTASYVSHATSSFEVMFQCFCPARQTQSFSCIQTLS